MQIEINKLPHSEIEIVGEISAGDFELCREGAVKFLSQETKIDGFRPGHAPEKILAEKIGEQSILERMAEIALNKAYPKILEENKIGAIGRPEITITKIAKNNPLGFKIKTAVMPEIELADYKKIAQEIMAIEEKIDVEEKEIDESVEYLRKTRAKENDKGEKIIPELNDEFAKSLGNFENMEALRKTLKDNLTEEKKMRAKEKKRINVIDKIAESSKMEIPDIIVKSEIEKMIGETQANISSAGLKWGDYLVHIKKTEDEIRKDWEKDALKRAKFGLVLNEIAGKEKTEVPEDELNKETAKAKNYYSKTGENIDEQRLRAYIYGILKNEKVFRLLESC